MNSGLKDALSQQDILSLISLCSKACLIDTESHDWDNAVEKLQYMVAVDQVVPILGKLDQEFPGYLPVPHDGRSWKVRASEDEYS